MAKVRFKRIPLAGTTSVFVDTKFDGQLSQNCYSVFDQLAREKSAVRRFPGHIFKKEFTDGDPSFNVRLLFNAKSIPDKLFAVVGSDIYYLDSLFQETKLTTIIQLGTSQGFVSAVSNGIYVMFVDGQDGYVYDNQTGTFQSITASGFPGRPLMCEILDGFFIVLNADSNQVFVSPVNDPLGSYSSFLANAREGFVIGVAVVDRRIFIFKQNSTEVWVDAGLSPVPFARDNSMIFDFGCLTSSSIAVNDGIMFFLSSNSNGVGSVMMSNGSAPQRISNNAIDDLIQGLQNPNDAIGIAFKQNGHVFYQLNFTQDDITLLYDMTTNLWQTLKTKSDNRHIANTTAFFQNKTYIGAYNSKKIFEQSSEYKTYDNEHIPLVRITPNFFSETNNYIKLNRVEIDCISGTGKDGLLKLEPDKNPKVYLSVSKDGGKTFGNKVGRSIGRIGDFYQRPRFYQKGIARQFTFKIEFFDDVDFSMWSLLLFYEE